MTKQPFKTQPKELVIGSKFSSHDSSIFVIDPLTRDIFGLQTERITRYKHDTLFPVPALSRFLSYTGIDATAVERIAFCCSFLGFKDIVLPEDQYERETALRRHFRASYKKDFEAAQAIYLGLPAWKKVAHLMTSRAGWYVLYTRFAARTGIRKQVPIESLMRRHVRALFPNARVEVRYYDHEYCHIVSSLATAPFDETLAWAVDGWGDADFSKAYAARADGLTPIASSPRQYVPPVMAGPDDQTTVDCSPGGIYTYFTEMLGFAPVSDEGKVEALAAYGTPDEGLLGKLRATITVDAQNLCLRVDRTAIETLLRFGSFEPLLRTLKKEDMAATVQKFLEAVSLEYVSLLVSRFGIRKLALSGGVAANVINNLGLYEHVTKDVHVTPAMADDGSAQGAAYAYLLENGHTLADVRAMTPAMPYYSTSYTREEVARALARYRGIRVKDLGASWPEHAARMLVDGKIGAIFHGRMEWGPRALGNRSIIADARRKDFRDIINRNIKRRPPFQPFCPSMLAEEKDRLFDSAYLNKHMTCAFRMKKEFWDALPSAIHVDGTARVQFVEEADNSAYWRLLTRVKELTGYGVIINTSFNKHGRTIVESPDDAVADFLDTDMDYCIIEGYLVERQTV